MYFSAGDGTLLYTWTEHCPKGTVYNRRKSGWYTLEIFEDWFRRIALPYFSKYNQDEKKVMNRDNLASHILPYILGECKKIT